MQTDYDFVRIDIDGRLLIVSIDRPLVRNALHAAAHDELEQIWDSFAMDSELWVAIVTGVGDRSFSAGFDLKSLATGGESRFARGGTGFGGLTERYNLDKPIIAAVNGTAFGGGFELALACDLIVAAETATFALPEPLVGLAALAGGAHRLAQQIPMKVAMGILLTGRTVEASEAHQIGLVNQVVPAAQLMKAARTWAANILRCAPLSVRATKQMANAGVGNGQFRHAVSLDLPAVKAVFKSQDRIEGPRAFVEKRAPRWLGK